MALILSGLLLSFSPPASAAPHVDARLRVGRLHAAIVSAAGVTAVADDGVVRVPTLPDVDPLFDPRGLSRGALPPPPADPSVRNDCDAQQDHVAVAAYLAQARAWAAWAVAEIDPCDADLDALAEAVATTKSPEEAAYFRALAKHLVRARAGAIRHVGFASKEPKGIRFVATRSPFTVGGPDVFIVSALPADADVPPPNLADLATLDEALNDSRLMFWWLPPGNTD